MGVTVVTAVVVTVDAAVPSGLLSGLDSAWVAGIFGFVGSVIGALAAIGSQWVTQDRTDRREADERRRQESKVRKRFAVYVGSLAVHLAMCADDSIAVDIRRISLRFIERSVEMLVRDFSDSALWIALEPQTIEALGLYLSHIQTFVSLGKASFQKPLSFTDEVGNASTFGNIHAKALAMANVLLTELGERPDRFYGRTPGA